MIDWSQLGFSYIKTNTMICAHYKDGKWGEIESRTDDNITISGLSASLHYGVECFEGLKAFNCKDGKVRIFRPDENAKRLIRSATYLGIAAPSEEMFIKMVKQAVSENKEFIPPYGTRASLYIRPTLIGVGAQLGVKSSVESFFFLAVAPVGNYAGGIDAPVPAVIAREYDRAAPKGSGSYKVGGNYAASLYAGIEAKNAGYPAVLYLDPKEHKYIDEFSSSNFFGIKGNKYITPDSHTVLPSITNKSLIQVAEDLGYEVERRPIPVEELATFDEVGECGTAVVITPISRIDDKPSIAAKEATHVYNYKACGPVSRKLYDTLTGIQYGEIEDKYGWGYIL